MLIVKGVQAAVRRCSATVMMMRGRVFVVAVAGVTPAPRKVDPQGLWEYNNCGGAVDEVSFSKDVRGGT